LAIDDANDIVASHQSHSAASCAYFKHCSQQRESAMKIKVKVRGGKNRA
jgi:hypothetical protein